MKKQKQRIRTKGKKKKSPNSENLSTEKEEKENNFYYWITIESKCDSDHRQSAKRLQKIISLFYSQADATYSYTFSREMIN